MIAGAMNEAFFETSCEGWMKKGTGRFLRFTETSMKIAGKGCHTVFDKIWVFPKIGVPQNGWFIREYPI